MSIIVEVYPNPFQNRGSSLDELGAAWERIFEALQHVGQTYEYIDLTRSVHNVITCYLFSTRELGTLRELFESAPNVQEVHVGVVEIEGKQFSYSLRVHIPLKEEK